MTKKLLTSLLLVIVLVGLTAAQEAVPSGSPGQDSIGPPAPAPPTNVRVMDKPNDGGHGLIVKWDLSKDGKTVTFYLRKGVQFQEGWGEMTSADVKYSIERMIDKTSIGSPAANLRNIIEKVEAPDPYTVVVTQKLPYIGLVGGYMNDTNAGGIIVSKKYVESVGDEKANAHPVGTGPYTLAEEHKKGGPIKLVTVPGVENHWRVTPAYKNVTFLLAPEEATRVAMLKNGEADLAPISYDSIDTVKASGLHIASIQKEWGPLIRFGGIVTTDSKRFNSSAPWAKKEVRQALNYAVDKEAIAKSIFKGEAVPTGASMPLGVWSDITPYPYDPAKAKQLLAQAGYPNGFPLPLRTFTTNPGAELPAIGEAVALYWKAVGIDVKIVKSGRLKDAGSPTRPMTDVDERYFQSLMDEVHRQFIAVVRDERKLPEAKVVALADGRVFTGEQAMKEKLIDTLGTYEESVAIAAELAGIKGEPSIVTEKKRVTFWNNIFGDMGETVKDLKQEILDRPVLSYRFTGP